MARTNKTWAQLRGLLGGVPGDAEGGPEIPPQQDPLSEGRGAFKRGDHATAVRLFGAVCAERPDDGWAWLWLSRAQAAAGDVPNATLAARRSVESKPAVGPARSQLMGLLRVSGAWPALVEVARSAPSTQSVTPQHEEFTRQLVLAHRALRGDKEAAAERREVAELLVHRFTLRAELAAERALAMRWLLARAVQEGDPAAACRHALPVLASSTDDDERLAVIRQLAATGGWILAKKALDTIADDDVHRLLSEPIAVGLRNTGHLRAALDVLTRTRLSDDKDVRELLSEINVLDGSWRPQPPTVSAYRPVVNTVLHVVGTSRPDVESGYAIRTASIVRAQRSAGIDVHVVTQPGRPGGNAVRVDHVDGAPHHRLPGCGSSPSRQEWVQAHVDGVAEVVRRIRPALLHAASDFYNAMTARIVGTAFGIPVVYEVRGFWEETWVSVQGESQRDADFYRWRREREAQYRSEADHVVTLARTMRTEIIEQGVPEDRITIVPNAVDVEAFPVVGRDEALAAAYGLDDADAVVGCISSLVGYEGIDFLLEAMSHLLRRGTKVRCLIVGDGVARQNLIDQAQRLGISDRVAFTGRVPHDQVLDYHGLIDLFVLPRTLARVCQLVSPLKPIEAMGTGRALLLADVAVLRELAADSNAAELFAAEDAIALADLVDELISDVPRRRELGGRAAAWVRQNRTWDVNGRAYVELYACLGAVDTSRLRPATSDSGLVMERRTGSGSASATAVGANLRVSFSPGQRLLSPQSALPPQAGDPVLAGVWRAVTAEALRPDCGVDTLLPHNATHMLEDSEAAAVLIETAAMGAGHPWAYLGSPAAPELEKILARVIEQARSQGRPVVLWDNLEHRPEPGIQRLARRCDLVVGTPGDERHGVQWSPGVQLSRYNPIGRTAHRGENGALWLIPAARDRSHAVTLAAALDDVPALRRRTLASRTVTQDPTNVSLEPALLGWRDAPSAFRAARAVISPMFLAQTPDSDTLHAEVAACGAMVIAPGADRTDREIGVYRVKTAEDARLAVTESADRVMDEMPDLRGVLRAIHRRFSTRSRLQELLTLLDVPASPDPAKDVAIITTCDEAGLVGMVRSVLRQTLRPRELVIGMTSGPADSGVLEDLRAVGVVVRTESMDGGAQDWARLAGRATRRWASVWEAVSDDPHLLADAVVARECSRADVIVQGRVGEHYAFSDHACGDRELRTPVLIERQRLERSAETPRASAGQGASVFSLAPEPAG